jgi:DnaA family protein
MHNKVSPQLTLGLSLKDEATFANFYPARNDEVIVELKKMASGQGEKAAYVCGARGQGRSHLLQAACHYAHQQHKSSAYLPLANLISLTPEVLNGFELLNLICIDDLQLAARHPEWEEAIFHLYNRIYDAGGKIIIAANDLPKAIHLQLPDLVSRLSWGMTLQLHSLTDAEKLSTLTMRANERGISLSEEVGKYILTHCPRHMGTLFAALDALDKASLAAQRRLTIPFVKEVLEI